jgi:hypothetical protein
MGFGWICNSHFSLVSLFHLANFNCWFGPITETCALITPCHFFYSSYTTPEQPDCTEAPSAERASADLRHGTQLNGCEYNCAVRTGIGFFSIFPALIEHVGLYNYHTSMIKTPDYNRWGKLLLWLVSFSHLLAISISKSNFLLNLWTIYSCSIADTGSVSTWKLKLCYSYLPVESCET